MSGTETATTAAAAAPAKARIPVVTIPRARINLLHIQDDGPVAPVPTRPGLPTTGHKRTYCSFGPQRSVRPRRLHPGLRKKTCDGPAQSANFGLVCWRLQTRRAATGNSAARYEALTLEPMTDDQRSHHG